VGQELTGTANALITLVSKNGQVPWTRISDLISQWQPQAFVVGLPLHRDGGEHAMTQAARRFGRQLQGRYHIPVFWVDERLTSVEAKHILSEQRAGAKRRAKSDVDKIAAQLILQAWFNQPAETNAHSASGNGADS
jgi:putative Holliday junction resolvase